MHGSQMIEKVAPVGKSQELRLRFASLKTDQAIERQFGDALNHNRCLWEDLAEHPTRDQPNESLDTGMNFASLLRSDHLRTDPHPDRIDGLRQE